MIIRILALTALLAALVPAGPATAQQAPVAEVLKAVGLDPSDLDKLKSGEAVTKPVRAMNDKDLGLLVAGWHPASTARTAKYVEQGRWMDIDPDIKSKAVIDPDEGVDALAGVAFDASCADEARDLLDVEPGDDFNLSSEEIKRFNALPREYPDDKAMVEAVSKAYRQMMHDRLKAYRVKGLDGIAPYDRGDGDKARPGDELALATRNALLIQRFYPAFHKMLLTYPANMPTGTTERFYLTCESLNGRPAFVLTHQMQRTLDNGAVLAVRQFYVGHSYDSMQITVGAFALDGGTLFVYRNNTYTEGVAGFASRLRHKLGLERMTEEVVKEYRRIWADIEAHP